MLLYYIRHADPIYNPDSLTPLGERQAEAVGRRLASHGVDKIFASSSIRAQLTAKPLGEMLKLPVTVLVVLLLCAFWVCVPLLVIGLGKADEEREIVGLRDGSTTYYREDGVHKVPKRALADIVLG